MKYYKVITLDPSKVVTYCKCHPGDFLYCSLSSLYPHSFWPNCLGFVNQDWCRVIQFAFPPKKNYPFQFNVTTVNWPGKLPFLWLQKKFFRSKSNLKNQKTIHKHSYNIIPLCIFVESAAICVQIWLSDHCWQSHFSHNNCWLPYYHMMTYFTKINHFKIWNNV